MSKNYYCRKPDEIIISRSQHSAFRKRTQQMKFSMFESHDLSSGAKALGLKLCEMFNPKHQGACWAVQKTLADWLNVKDTKTIRKYLSELKNGNWIVVQSIPGKSANSQYFMGRKLGSWAELIGLEEHPQNIEHDTTKRSENISSSYNTENPNHCKIKEKDQRHRESIPHAMHRESIPYAIREIPCTESHVIDRGINPPLEVEAPNNFENEGLEPSLHQLHSKQSDPPPVEKSQKSYDRKPAGGSKPKTKARKSKSKPQRFKEFFSHCLNQQDPTDAEGKYNRIVQRGEATEEALIVSMAAYAALLKARNKTEYSKKAGTWLFQKCWQNPPEKYAPNADKPTGKLGGRGRSSAFDSIRDVRSSVIDDNPITIEGTCYEQ